MRASHEIALTSVSWSTLAMGIIVAFVALAPSKARAEESSETSWTNTASPVGLVVWTGLQTAAFQGERVLSPRWGAALSMPDSRFYMHLVFATGGWFVKGDGVRGADVDYFTIEWAPGIYVLRNPSVDLALFMGPGGRWFEARSTEGNEEVCEGTGEDRECHTQYAFKHSSSGGIVAYGLVARFLGRAHLMVGGHIGSLADTEAFQPLADIGVALGWGFYADPDDHPRRN